MPEPVTAKLLKPKSPDEFEDLVLDVLNHEWHADLKRNGRSGQKQKGVDLYGKRSRRPKSMIGVQCKNTATLSARKIRNEVKKAESFRPRLTEYYFATSLDRDGELQGIVRLLSEERVAKGKFAVEIVFWEDLERMLAGSPALTAKYYGAFFRSRETELAQLLYPPYKPLPATSSADARSFAIRLKPRYQETRFVGREEELRALMAWAERPEPVGPRLQLCIGPGGEGKTRLAAEFATQLQAKAWVVGFVRPDAEPEKLAEALQAAASNVLLVVDYAGRRVEQLVGILNAAERGRSGRTALLLLERSQGEWWQQLGDRLQGTGAAQDAVAVAVALELKPLSESDRKDMFEAASAKYRPGAAGALPRDDNALAVQIAALLGVSGNRDELLAELLKREGMYWRQMAAAHQLSEDADTLAAAVALTTLTRPNKEEASALLQLVFKRARVKKAVAWLSELYPGENTSIGSLEPDMVGEALIAETLRSRPAMLGALLETVNGRVAGNVFDALARTDSARPEVHALVSEALQKMPLRLWVAAVQAAPTMDATFAGLLTEAFASSLAIPCAPVLKAVPETTLCLRELAASAQERQVLELREKHRLDQTNSDAFLPALAASLNNLSVRLGGLGRRKEGLRAVEEAVESYRKLAATRRDAFLPYVATSLHNLSIRLGELGHREEALRAEQEAVEIFRELAEVRPDAFLPDLAMSLTNLSSRMGELGQREEGLRAAQEAVDIRRKLAEERPDAFLPDLAISLNNLSVRLVDLGRREEGLRAVKEAVESYRKLAKERPDAFLPDLAMSLNNLSICLRELERPEDGLRAVQEAMGIRRKLAEERPDAILPDVAESLNNLAGLLWQLGHREEGLRAVQEAVEIRRKLAEARPAAFLPDLAVSLNNLSLILRSLGRHDEAQRAADEAAALEARRSS